MMLYEEHAFCPRKLFNIYYTSGLGTVTLDPKIDQLSEKKIIEKKSSLETVFFLRYFFEIHKIFAKSVILKENSK